tara:strand:- start:315 stop:1208 length:894 start_codon:yes stop_codon:yes gene_type:complete
MNDKHKKQGLGRGLSTLLAESLNNNNEDKVIQPKKDSYLPIDKIFPNPDQPRKKFDKSKLEELAKSISANGIIQPIIVRSKNSKYELVAGERRWRAAQLAQIHSIPAIIREITDEQVAEFSIVENVQREDLTVIEEARSYKTLVEVYSYTQEDVSLALGKSRSYVANILRLLTLPDLIINFLEESKLSIGHARALIGVSGAEAIAKQIISKKLSVRQTEALVKRIRLEGTTALNKKLFEMKKSIDTLNLEKSLTAQTSFRIHIEENKDRKGGKLIIKYSTLDELDRLCDLLNNINST